MLVTKFAICLTKARISILTKSSHRNQQGGKRLWIRKNLRQKYLNVNPVGFYDSLKLGEIGSAQEICETFIVTGSKQ